MISPFFRLIFRIEKNNEIIRPPRASEKKPLFLKKQRTVSSETHLIRQSVQLTDTLAYY